jgi:signal transduction histidine kinase
MLQDISRSGDLWTARVDVVARAFSLFGGFSIAAITGNAHDAAGVTVLLIATATLMTWWAAVVGPYNPTYRAALVIEGVFTLFLVASSTQAADPYVIYLLAPALLTGLRGSVLSVVVLLACELGTVLVIQAQQASLRSDFLETAGPWILTGWAISLLGLWIRQLRRTQRDLRSSPYAYTHRLLAQLRTITRGLPGGLDVTAVSEDVLDMTIRSTGGVGAVLILRGEGKGLRVIASQGELPNLTLVQESEIVAKAMREQHAVHEVDDTGTRGEPVHRTCWPLVVGHRTIGVVVVDGLQPLDEQRLAELQDLNDEAALRLESSLLFNDVRSLATVEERQRLAREIHDGVAQEIGALGYLVDDLARDDCDREHGTGLKSLRDELTRVVSDLRLSIYDLRSGVSSSAGLGSVLGDYVREVGRQSGMTVHLSLEESPHRLRLDVETELLRIAQEAVNNARKHSHAENLWVTCRVEPPFAEIRIEDDGVGAAKPIEGHYGMSSMHERAERVNAVLNVADRPGGGTAVAVVLLPPAIPVQPHETPEHQSGESHVLQRSAGR